VAFGLDDPRAEDAFVEGGGRIRIRRLETCVVEAEAPLVGAVIRTRGLCLRVRLK
jgi:hypothetical protein